MRFVSVRSLVRLFAASLSLTLALSWVLVPSLTAAPEAAKLLSPADAKQKMEQPGVIVLDVRTPEEYREGHLKNAVLLPVNTVEAKATSVLKDKNQPVLVYCHSGSRSARAVKMLKAQGYTAVSDLDGGIIAWSEAGLPIVK